MSSWNSFFQMIPPGFSTSSSTLPEGDSQREQHAHSPGVGGLQWYSSCSSGPYLAFQWPAWLPWWTGPPLPSQSSIWLSLALPVLSGWLQIQNLGFVSLSVLLFLSVDLPMRRPHHELFCDRRIQYSWITYVVLCCRSRPGKWESMTKIICLGISLNHFCSAKAPCRTHRSSLTCVWFF